ncbi:hypothetical protein CN918_32640 [Priestia megaterium]|nr:hypothetical protein CN918_32640 [Priestia megaterium]
MKQVDDVCFISEIKNADIICSTHYGYALFRNKQNPYHYHDFCAPPNAKFYMYDGQFGKVLKLTQNKKMVLLAFVTTSLSEEFNAITDEEV